MSARARSYAQARMRLHRLQSESQPSLNSTSALICAIDIGLIFFGFFIFLFTVFTAFSPLAAPQVVEFAPVIVVMIGK